METHSTMRAQKVEGSRNRHRAGEPSRYRVWQAIIARCTNQKCRGYCNYGGRGIAVCDRWRNSFQAFCDDMGPRPIGTTIDRIDNDGNYEPGNVRWATWHIQTRNKSTNRYLTYGGKTLILTDWASMLGISKQSLASRLKRHPIEVALSNDEFARQQRKALCAPRPSRQKKRSAPSKQRMTPSQAQWNRSKRGGYSSSFKGVRRDGKKWRAEIRFLGKQRHLGLFLTEEEAARAYDAKAAELFGEFARLNFPTQASVA